MPLTGKRRLKFIRQKLADGMRPKEIAPLLGMTHPGMATCLYREIHRCGHETALQWVVAGIRKGEIR